MSIFGFTFIYTTLFNIYISVGMLVIIGIISHFIIANNLLNVFHTRWLVRIILIGASAMFMNPLAMESRYLSTGVAASLMAGTSFLTFALAAIGHNLGKQLVKDSFKVSGSVIAFFFLVFGFILLIWTVVYFGNSAGQS